ncbi:ribonuclease T2 [uncultured Roseobacter sp.]|uniref:ribonuclease T2 n=1 Tax=uncultured Roseobacter sp. TaxID=114847 RepID=UPI002624B8F0|nr:ribonuclease T2 [uncultured Roseobacter sp.]
MRCLLFWLMITLAPAAGAQDRSGEFDYYVMSLSWSPNWCSRTGDARGSPQCDPGKGHGWILHGLWPQYERGYPEYCKTAERQPSRRMTSEMADIMGTSGLAWHQWKKHGTCSGLSAAGYYALSRDAYGTVTRPAVFRKLNKAVRLPASVVEEAFLRDNPGLSADMITITCKQDQIQEARICLDRDLAPRRCGPDVLRDCSSPSAFFDAIR